MNNSSSDLSAMRLELKRAVHKYNACRPHNSLDGLTPLDIALTLSETSLQSQTT